MFGLIITSVNSGSGRHIYYLSPKQLSTVVKLEMIEGTLIVFSIMCPEMSICLFLVRIFKINRVWRRAMYIIMTLIVVTSLSSAIAPLPRCKPVAKAWNPTIKGTFWSTGTTTHAIIYYSCGKYPRRHTLFDTLYSCLFI